MSLYIAHVKNKAHLRSTLLAVSTLYFAFGFITCLNDILVPHLKSVFDLTYAKAALVQFSFFTAYFIMSVPSGWLVDRVGYKRGMVGGLLTAAAGCLLFHPAAGIRSYPLFLLALFILAAGITLLQVAGNPYVALLGRPETASSRLTLAGGFNSLGTTLAPLFGAQMILAVAARPLAGGSLLEAQRSAEASAVQVPYLGLAAGLLLLATGTALFRMPLGEARPETSSPGEQQGGILGQLGRQRQLALGIIGIFMYVGAEVAISSFLVNYISLPSIGGIPLAASARYVSLYWGGAMVGRFLGAGVMRVVPPGRLLTFNALAAGILVLTAILTRGFVSMWAILSVGFFNSIMFPTIFVLALKGRARQLGRASGILCMAIVGGAVVPVLQGLLADAVGMRTAFLLPVVCYAYIAFYGASSARAAAMGGRP